MDATLPPPAGGSVTAPEATSASVVPSSSPASASTASGAVLTAPVAAPASQPVVATPTVRDDQVKNAVDFLSHPQVRSSTNTASKRSFLERKGLTAAEIDEAFRRVPEAPPAAATAPSIVPAAPAPAATTLPATQPVTYLTQPGVQGQQLAVVQQPYIISATPGAGQLVPVQPTAQMPAAVQAPVSYRWSQVVLGVGLVAAAGWAVQQLVLPRVRAMVDSWISSRREAEEARLKELTAAVEKGLKGCQEELKQSTQALVDAVALMREQQRVAAAEGARGVAASARHPTTTPVAYYPAISPSSNRYDQPYGANGLAPVLPPDNYAAIRAAAGYTNAYPPDAPTYTVSYGRDSGPPTAGPTGGDNSRAGGNGAPVYGTPTAASHVSYPGSRPTGNGPYGPASGNTGGAPPSDNLPYKVTAPPSPTNSIHSQRAGRPAQQQQTGGIGARYGSSDRLYEQQPVNGVLRDPTPSRTMPPAPPEQPEYPRSFHEVMAMVQQGITPPNVRTDINDLPPDPTRPLSESRLPAPSKPWERNASTSGGSGTTATANGSANANPLYGSSPSSSAGGTGYTPYSATMAAPYKSTAGIGNWNTAPSTSDGSGASDASGKTGGGGGGGSSSLSVLPPANPAWRPPPPPMRTVISSTPSSPPTTSSTGMAAAAADGTAGAAAPAVPAAASPPPPPPSPPAAAPPEAPAAFRPPVVAVGGPQLAAATSSDMAPSSPPPSQPSYVAATTGQSAANAEGPGISGSSAAEAAGADVATTPAVVEDREGAAAVTTP